ncbi:hypothetical protein, partial [Gemmatimonas sp.]|uniref:hypothetical protein n=1 Tax=Gemmatimonas sp. TaxID=1962908 RepID=UPI0037BF3C95
MVPTAVLGPALLFFTAGVLHFVIPGFFDRIVPPWMPNARVATYVSGVFEMLGAIGLLVPATRVAAAWGLIALLVAVLPANIHMLNQARAAQASVGYIVGLWLR